MKKNEKDIETMERIKQDSTFRERSLLRIIEKLQKENEELKADNYELNNRINDLLDNIPDQKIKDILNEINKEYIKQEEIFNKYFEKENRDMQDYYIQKEATNIMQELSWVEGKIQELLEGRE